MGTIEYRDKNTHQKKREKTPYKKPKNKMEQRKEWDRERVYKCTDPVCVKLVRHQWYESWIEVVDFVSYISLRIIIKTSKRSM